MLKNAVLLAIILSLVACDQTHTEPKLKSDAGSSKNDAAKRNHKMPERRLEGVPKTGVELGMGWDSRRGEIVPNHCLDFSPIRASGQEISMNLSEVSDQSEMMDSLKVGAEVSVKSMFGSGTAKANFARNSKVNSSSTTLLLQATVENGVLFVGPPDSPGTTRTAFPDPADQSRNLRAVVESMGISVDANGQVNQNTQTGRHRNSISPEVSFKPEIIAKVESPDKFREHCGDYFVSAVFSGAQLFATISFKASSQEESKSLSASVEADFGTVSGGASIDSNSSGSQSSTSMKMKFIQVGGGPGMIPTSKEALQQKLRELAIEASGNPKFHTIELRSYREIAESDGLVFDSKDAEFEVVSDYYWMLSSLYDEIETIRENPVEYHFMSGLSLSQLMELQDEVLEVRRALYEIMDAYFEGREPDASIIQAVEHQWFPGDAGKPYLLDLVPSDTLTEADAKSQGACIGINWFECLIEKFDRAVPQGNPNTIRLLLPLPINQVGAAKISTTDDYKQEVLNHYIRRQSSRMCDLDPTDNECMSNAEISALADLIPVSSNKPPKQAMIKSHTGGCLSFIKSSRAYVIQDFVQAHAMNYELVTKSCEKQADTKLFSMKNNLINLNTKECLLAAGDELLGSTCPNKKKPGFNDWQFYYTGHIGLKSTKKCLTAPKTMGHKVTLKKCQFADPYQHWFTDENP